VVQVWRLLTGTYPGPETGATAMTRMQARMAPPVLGFPPSGMRTPDPVYMTASATTEVHAPTAPFIEGRKAGKNKRSSTSRAEGRRKGKSTSSPMEADKEISRLRESLAESEREEQKMEMKLKAQEIELLAEEIAQSQHRRDESRLKLHQHVASHPQQYPGVHTSAGAVSGVLTDRPVVPQVQHGGWYSDRPSVLGQWA